MDTTETNYDVIIIGGGLGGLTTAAKLSKEGRKVLLLEQHYIPGGCATTFKRKEYVVEVGLHEMDGLGDSDDIKAPIFKDLDIFKNIDSIKIPEFYRTTIGDTLDVTIPYNINLAKQVLKKKYPKEEKGIDTYFDYLHGMRKEVLKASRMKKWVVKMLLPVFPLIFPYLGLSQSPLITTLSKLNPLFWIFRGYRFGRWNHYTIGSFLDAIFKEDEIKTVLLANLGYYHDDPYSLNMIFFGVAQGGYMQGGGWFIKGGSQKLSNYLFDLINSNGGTAVVGKRVTEIITEKGKATGVKFQNAFDAHAPIHQAHAHVIVANAAVPNVVDMLTGESKKVLHKQIKDLKVACSLISVYVGFKCNVSKKYNKGAYSTFICSDVREIYHRKEKDTQRFPIEERGYAFVDYSKIDAGLCPENRSVGVLCTVDHLKDWSGLSEEAYKAKKERVAKRYIERLNEVFPGIAEDIAYCEVGTARTVQSYTLNPNGTPYGFAQTQKQGGMLRVQNKSSIPHLYFASAWSMPGGGFTGAIYSGYDTAEMILKAHPKRNNLRPETPIDTQTAKLISRNTMAKNTFELVFEKPRDFESFTPGQYAVVSLDNPAYTTLDMPLRPLSIASHPDENVLRFAMRTSDSAFKKSCLALQPGDTAKLYGPKGDFTLKPSDRGWVFLVAGIGITPVLSMLKELEKQKETQPIYLLYANASEDEITYQNELRKLQLSQFHYIDRLSKVQGRIDAAFIKNQIPQLDAFDYYLVGTSSFLKSMSAILTQFNIPKNNVHIDDFG